jgi:hypothetical protein
VKTFQPEWHQKKPPFETSMMFDRDSGVLGATVRTQHSLAEIEVGRYTKQFGREGRWRFYWAVEFHVRAGWSPRFNARGHAKTLKHAQQCAMNSVMAFIASADVKHKPKSDKQIREENDILRELRSRYQSGGGLLRYVISRDMKDGELKETLLRYASVERIG